MSRNPVEIVRRHHEVGAPTALEVLKEAMERRGEITDEDRHAAAERSGLPEARVHGFSTFYDDLLQPRGARHVRVCTGTACFAATGGAHVDALRARVPERIEPGHVFTAFHFPEIRTNRLIGSSVGVNTSCPEYKVVAVDVRPVAEQAGRTPAIASAS